MIYPSKKGLFRVWDMGWMMLGMFLFWGLLIFAAVWFVRLLFTSGTSQSSTPEKFLTPTQVVDLRYIRGEITREQYKQMKKDLAL
ncbi:MAG TPA: SHOCT domain-containing protein [Anaerolineaceae bacterium]|nr:SHOCT domain-containing protein [Anaerolineaceae bacterium]